ncbi:biopolymer transporter ExbD [Stenotrophomonas acidaminiphila]|uniref:Biopolymer transporter ExbD n=1 Tax=Stenotrophomonas nitritireducens TaxID=83617 RepID=A0ABR5NG82_9GAMM|nr:MULTISPECIES: biopolymer transporter ExbD [Stenotrophomonas]AUZ53789.1 biopolymer transporter ExbD [Stenotrophomonas acidaminiphila]KQN97933.1 biopolymer transporter ExbD [Stenotrophomonas sp. Leaf70]KRG54661.1 biopolymer transporter ExbD [Stenotrophomonas nitritireducens]MBN8793188.1 biopolymer transporter ExbD [Stenotrophomonas nitritireducens]MBN8797219.1 biopolymer transporter ExbD [Stenotrophomonas nitritireducens]
MAFSSGGNRGPMADINVTPLVDVMLVLLIIFIVTAPIMTYPIAVDLPQRVINPPPQLREPPPPIDLRVDASNQVYWNNSPVNVNELQQKMEEEVQKDPTNQPELRIDANPDSEYEVMAKILAQAKNAQMKKIGFVQ